MNQNVLAIALIVVGVLLLLVQKMSLGHLPGDFVWHGKNWTISFPLMTCILASIAVMIIMRLFGKH